MDNYGNDFNQQQSNNGPQLEPPMKMSDWLITLLITAIPCVNIVMLFVWAFGQGGSTSKKNYCRAVLIFMAIGGVISFILYSTILGAAFNTLSDLSNL